VANNKIREFNSREDAGAACGYWPGVHATDFWLIAAPAANSEDIL